MDGRARLRVPPGPGSAFATSAVLNLVAAGLIVAAVPVLDSAAWIPMALVVLAVTVVAAAIEWQRWDRVIGWAVLGGALVWPVAVAILGLFLVLAWPVA